MADEEASSSIIFAVQLQSMKYAKVLLRFATFMNCSRLTDFYFMHITAIIEINIDIQLLSK